MTQIKVVTPEDKDEILKQIEALEWQIKEDTNDKDRQIHKVALKELKDKLIKSN